MGIRGYAVLILAVGGCANDADLAVDVRTDLAPGIEFHAVRLTVEGPGSGGVERVAPAFSGQDFLAGQRVAEVGGLAVGSYTVRAMLLDAAGETVAARDSRIELGAEGTVALMVIPRASRACAADEECSAHAACARGTCDDGTCLVFDPGGTCPAEQWCDPALGCVARPASDVVPFAEFGEAFAMVYCILYERCVPEQLAALRAEGIDCTDLFPVQGIQQEFLAPLEAAVARGTVLYHGDLVRECVTALGSTCTAADHRWPEVCGRALEGRIPLGSPCSFSFECAAGAFCRPEGSCGGRCATPAAEGEPCVEQDDECGQGLLCAAGVCRPPLALGAPCGGSADARCAFGAQCMDADGAGGICAGTAQIWARSAGERCDLPRNQYCLPGLSCSLGAGGMQTCIAPLESGAACRIGIPDPCPIGEVCAGLDVMAGDYDGNCAPAPGAGEPCSSVLGPWACADGLVCLEGTCRARQPVGGPCAVSGQCWSGLCDTTTLTCAPRVLCPP